MMAGSILTFSDTSRPVTDFSAALQRVEILVAERLGDGDVGRRFALERRDQHTERLDNVAYDKKAAIDGEYLQEFCRSPAQLSRIEDRAERFELLLGRKDRASDQTGKICALSNHGIEPIKIGLHHINGSFVSGELK